MGETVTNARNSATTAEASRIAEKANPEIDTIHKNDKSEIQSSIKWVSCDGEATAPSQIK